MALVACGRRRSLLSSPPPPRSMQATIQAPATDIEGSRLLLFAPLAGRSRQPPWMRTVRMLSRPISHLRTDVLASMGLPPLLRLLRRFGSANRAHCQICCLLHVSTIPTSHFLNNLAAILYPSLVVTLSPRAFRTLFDNTSKVVPLIPAICPDRFRYGALHLPSTSSAFLKDASTDLW